MLTRDQIKKLKPGDPLIVHGTFKEEDEEGDVWIDTNYYSFFVKPSCIALPDEKPEHAPSRLFKKGDRIRFKTWHGFQPEDWENDAELLGKEATVYEDQKPDDFSVHFLFDGEDPDEEWHATYLPFIELITPVEELGPYSVRHNEVHAAWSIYGPYDLSAVNYFYGERYPYTEESAKAAAEAECARLNAEWRKEQK